MTGTVFTSAASHSRLKQASAWLDARDPGEELVIVGASLPAANELARNLAHVKGAAFGWHRSTLARLAAEIAAPALKEGGLVPITRLGSEALIARLVQQKTLDGTLGRYTAIAQTPGFARAMASAIGEVRLAAPPEEAVAAGARELAELAAAYATELGEIAVTDWPAIFALAAEHAAAYRLAGCPLLFLDVPITTEAEIVFLEALAASASAVLAVVPAADEVTLINLCDRLRWRLEDLDSASEATTTTTLALLQRNLFREGSLAAPTGTGEPVAFFSAPSEGRECVEIARRVLALASDGVPFDRIAVLLRSPELYRAHLEEAFTRAGIPAHFARGARRPDPAGRAFIALVTCAADDLSARRFAEYLSLGQVPDAAADGAPPLAAERGDRWVAPDSELLPEAEFEAEDTANETFGGSSGAEGEAPVRDGRLRAPWRWEKLLVEAAVIGGKERWHRRIDGLAHDLRVRMTEVEEDDSAEMDVLADQMDELAAFRAYALPLIDELATLPGSAIWAEWLDQLGALATRALKRPERVLAILGELAPLGPVGPIALPEVLRVLGPLLLETVTRPGPQRYGKVFVGPVELVRGLSFDAVFIPGLAERLFPRKIVEEPILLDRARADISPHLIRNQGRLAAERLALKLAAGAAENRICFSYPRLDLEGSQPRPRVPSFYALEMLRAGEGRLPDFTEVAQRAETVTTARLGWPAPPDPMQAIDDAEYDLAILERLASAAEAEAGTARYLVKANIHLYRALGARFQRWGFSWTSADGLITRATAARTLMAQHAFGMRGYSPTALQHYARCPYRFFLSAIQRLAPRAEPEPIDELDPLQRGALIHAIQFELFAHLSREGLLPVRPAHLDRAWQLLESVTADIAARYYDQLAPAIDRVWRDGIDAITADLREWLRRASEDDSGFVPRHFELAFGLRVRGSQRAADPRSAPGAVTVIGGLQLRGSIDLVEAHPSGPIRVTDHKTGKVDGKAGQVIAGGTTLQPLLYALAAEKLFSGQALIDSGRLYFCTAAGGYTVIDVPLDDQARAAAVEVAGTIGDALAGPFLPAAPDKGVCTFCDFRSICGPHEERRVSRKPKSRLGPLLALRAAP